MMMFFSERKKLSEEYEKWVSENKDVLDCPLTVISWLVAEGYVGKTKVADLEAKLAESDAYKLRIELAGADETILQLKQQLAEKDEEIEKWKTKWCKSETNSLRLYEQSQNNNQNKISFAVEQLEKVKNYLTQELENVTELLNPLEYEDYHEFIGCGRGYKNSIEEIDNQIKRLKEME